MRHLLSLAALLLFLAVNADGFVFSCEEVRYRLVNSNLQEDQIYTKYVCVVPEENYANPEILKNIYAQNDKVSSSFYDISRVGNFCLERAASAPWRVVADDAAAIDCAQEFSLIFTSDLNAFALMLRTEKKPWSSLTNYGWMSQAVIVSPGTGIQLTKTWCNPSNVDTDIYLFSGAGTDEAEFRYPIASWKCSEMPDVLVSFESVLTITAVYALNFTLSSYDAIGMEQLTVQPGQRLVVQSSGRSDNLQNYRPGFNAAIFALPSQCYLSVNSTALFDASNSGSVDFSYNNADGKTIIEHLPNVGIFTVQSNNFRVEYSSGDLKPQDVWDNQDTFMVQIDIGGEVPPSTTPSTPTEPGPYCQCPVDRFYFPDGWDSTQIWIDVVIVLDTTEAMGSTSLIDAAYQIESFIDSNLITDTTSSYYTRVGLIAMSDRPEIIYDLNMTSTDTVVNKVSIKNVDSMDVTGSIQAAEEMFNRGLVSQPDRVNARQVIYYMTDSDPSFNLNPANQFKNSKGVIIVNNFIEEGAVERPGLKNLSSPGFYYSDLQENYMKTIQAFCLANCFCPGDKDRYDGVVDDPQLKPNGGCFHPVPAGVPFSKAKASCASNAGGIIATIHDEKKASFVNGLMRNVIAAPKTYFFWIGYSKGDDNQFHWEDNSTDPYANWDTNEPSNAAVAKCVFVDESNSALPWGAGNCQIGFPYVCEYKPCGVGNKNCFGISP